MCIYVFVVWMRWIAVVRIRIMEDLQDYDDAGASFYGFPLSRNDLAPRSYPAGTQRGVCHPASLDCGSSPQ